MRDEVTLKGASHNIIMRRYERGRSPVGNRTMYGWDLKCSSCTWSMRCNETKREARSHALDHLKAVRDR